MDIYHLEYYLRECFLYNNKIICVGQYYIDPGNIISNIDAGKIGTYRFIS